MSEPRPIDPARRALLAAGAATLAEPGIATAGILPRERGDWAAADPELAHRLRSRFADLRAGMEAGLLLDPEAVEGHFGDLATVRQASERMREGLAALELFKELERVPVEAQAQPHVQALLREVVRKVGQSIETAADWLHGWADGPGLTMDPDESHLRAALRAVHDAFGQGPLSASQRERAEAVYADLTEEMGPNSLRPRVRRALRRTEKARRLARELARHPAPTGLFDCTDPTIQQRVRAALPEGAVGQSAGALAGEHETLTEEESASLRLGIFGLGIVVTGGVFIIIVGICVFACAESAVGLLLMLAGVGLIVLARRGIRKRKRVLAGEEEADAPAQAEFVTSPGSPSAPPQMSRTEPKPVPVLWVEVSAQEGWVATGVTLQPGDSLTCEGWGTIVGVRTWVADPNGDGVLAGPEAPLPGSPSRALIGRVGSRTLFIGAAANLPADLEGPLELGINISPAQRADVRGAFSVLIRPASPASGVNDPRTDAP